jgi:hypothetical protein
MNDFHELFIAEVEEGFEFDSSVLKFTECSSLLEVGSLRDREWGELNKFHHLLVIQESTANLLRVGEFNSRHVGSVRLEG